MLSLQKYKNGRRTIYISDLIHGITENGLRHASGLVHAKHPIRYIYVTVELDFSLTTTCPQSFNWDHKYKRISWDRSLNLSNQPKQRAQLGTQKVLMLNLPLHKWSHAIKGKYTRLSAWQRGGGQKSPTFVWRHYRVFPKSTGLLLTITNTDFPFWQLLT